jgi:hypothetical protein
MFRSIACCLLAGLALTAYSGTPLAADRTEHLVPDMDIVVGGRPQPQYRHNGRLFVEALKGREYQIRLRNPYDVRVAVALSVDGLNTIDARETTAGSARKWVLGPRQTVVLSGWQVSQDAARRFEFTTEEQSYGRALGRTANLGIISAVFFKERTPIVFSQPSNDAERRDAAAPAAPAPSAREASAAGAAKAQDEYAATGMGRRTDHAVQHVWLDLEDIPAATVNIRYEFRAQLVRLGVVRDAPDPLERRERARGFEPGFSPEVPLR